MGGELHEAGGIVNERIDDETGPTHRQGHQEAPVAAVDVLQVEPHLRRLVEKAADGAQEGRFQVDLQPEHLAGPWLEGDGLAHRDGLGLQELGLELGGIEGAGFLFPDEKVLFRAKVIVAIDQGPQGEGIIHRGQPLVDGLDFRDDVFRRLLRDVKIIVQLRQQRHEGRVALDHGAREVVELVQQRHVLLLAEHIDGRPADQLAGLIKIRLPALDGQGIAVTLAGCAPVDDPLDVAPDLGLQDAQGAPGHAPEGVFNAPDAEDHHRDKDPAVQEAETIRVIQQRGIGRHGQHGADEESNHVPVGPDKAMLPIEVDERHQHQRVGDGAGPVRVELQVHRRVGDHDHEDHDALPQRRDRRREAHGPLVALTDGPGGLKVRGEIPQMLTAQQPDRQVRPEIAEQKEGAFATALQPQTVTAGDQDDEGGQHQVRELDLGVKRHHRGDEDRQKFPAFATDAQQLKAHDGNHHHMQRVLVLNAEEQGIAEIDQA